MWEHKNYLSRKEYVSRVRLFSGFMSEINFEFYCGAGYKGCLQRQFSHIISFKITAVENVIRVLGLMANKNWATKGSRCFVLFDTQSRTTPRYSNNVTGCSLILNCARARYSRLLSSGVNVPRCDARLTILFCAVKL